MLLSAILFHVSPFYTGCNSKSSMEMVDFTTRKKYVYIFYLFIFILKIDLQQLKTTTELSYQIKKTSSVSNFTEERTTQNTVCATLWNHTLIYVCHRTALLYLLSLMYKTVCQIKFSFFSFISVLSDSTNLTHNNLPSNHDAFAGECGSCLQPLISSCPRSAL